MAPIPAKPALHAGVWFRSRLEATWAAFFDHHAVAWEYEERWFNFDAETKYLPDFWLPASRAWVEVKGVLDDRSFTKIKKLAGAASFRGELIILAGAPAGLVFGEVLPSGQRIGIDMVRCRNCDLFTFSALSCRHCEHYDGDRTFDDEHSHLGGPCRSRVPVLGDVRGTCRGAFIYGHAGLIEDDSTNWLERAREHAAQLGIEQGGK